MAKKKAKKTTPKKKSYTKGSGLGRVKTKKKRAT